MFKTCGFDSSVRVLSFPNAFDISSELGVVGEVEERVFPDGEVLVRLPDVGGEVALVLRLFPNVNDNLIKLLLAIDALNDMGARRVILVLPYLPYSRQDRRFRPGEPISSKTLLKTFSAFSVHTVITVDLHKSYISEYAPRVLIKNLYPAAEFAARVSADVVLSPDVGSLHRAEILGSQMGVPHTHFVKSRDRNTGVVVLTPKSDVELRGMRVAIVDDIVSTGGTLVEACRAAKTLGASRVYALITHCLFVKDARDKVLSCVDRVICTDTVLNEFAEVKVGPLLRKALDEVTTSNI